MRRRVIATPYRYRTRAPAATNSGHLGPGRCRGFADPQASSSASSQVIRDVEDRWIQARRIWNQHTYHVTNVREDGTIPQVEPHHWELLNTFRTNAQIEGGGGVCMPVPAG